MSKGQTITPALVPIPNALGTGIEIVGFSGMSELDLAALMMAQALIIRGHMDVAKEAVEIAKAVLAETNKGINNTGILDG